MDADVLVASVGQSGVLQDVGRDEVGMDHVPLLDVRGGGGDHDPGALVSDYEVDGRDAGDEVRHVYVHHGPLSDGVPVGDALLFQGVPVRIDHFGLQGSAVHDLLRHGADVGRVHLIGMLSVQDAAAGLSLDGLRQVGREASCVHPCEIVLGLGADLDVPLVVRDVQECGCQRREKDDDDYNHDHRIKRPCRCLRFHDFLIESL